MRPIREFAPAKVNLTLRVLGRRSDGYHELESLVAFAAEVGDIVTLDTCQPIGVTVAGPFAGSIAGVNLVETTLQLIACAAPQLRLGALHIEKNLPVAAGIGGGSADAAAVMRAVMRANFSTAVDVDWQAVALKLGADVPVCLNAKLAWMSGVGEIVQPVELASDSGDSMKLAAILPSVVVNPRVPVPLDKTAQVFRALNAPPLPDAWAAQPRELQLTDEEVIAFARSSPNSLQDAARRIVPEVDEVLEALASCPGNLLVRMSGAGPTCFALFDSAKSALEGSVRLTDQHPNWWIRACALR